MLRVLPVDPSFSAAHAVDLVAAVLVAGDRPLAPMAAGTAAPDVDVPGAAQLLRGAAAVLPTSGSTARPKHVVLGAPALLASAMATHDRVGGPGQWLLALPVQHVAGWQVLVRSALSGTVPVHLDAASGFTAEGFAAAAEQLSAVRRYTSLVPTQLTRLLESPAGREALAGFDAVLVGGAALPAGTATSAAEAGVRVLSTYGMTETAGGCLYDGEPLAGVRMQVDEAGRVVLGGPTLARGYLGRPELTARRFFTDGEGARWFLTDDLGRLELGRLTVLGRADDIINTGGVKVAPGEVEVALRELPAVRDCAVVGVPDPQWGTRVAAAVVPTSATDDVRVATVRGALRGRLPDAALPHQVLALDRLPLLPTGKVDRLSLRRLLTAGGGTM